MTRKVIKVAFRKQVLKKQLELGRNLTNKELAEALGASEHTIGNWMDGEDLQTFKRGFLERAMDYFDCDLHDILITERVAISN